MKEYFSKDMVFSVRERIERFGYHPLVESVGSSYLPFRNQDASFSCPRQGVFGVFDGVSGMAYGAYASKMAGRYLSRELANIPNTLSLKTTVQCLEKKLLSVSDLLYEENVQRVKNRIRWLSSQRRLTDMQFMAIGPQLDPHDRYAIRIVREQMQREGRSFITKEDRAILQKGVAMATTAVVTKLWEGSEGQYAVVGSIGDSRAYRYREGKLVCITTDDTLLVDAIGEKQAKNVQDARDKGIPLSDIMITLSQQDKNHQKIVAILNRRNNDSYVFANGLVCVPFSEFTGIKQTELTQVLGINPRKVSPNLYVCPITSGDILLLASDGFLKGIERIDQIAEILSRPNTNKKQHVIFLFDAERKKVRLPFFSSTNYLSEIAREIAEFGKDKDDSTVNLIKIK